MANELDVAFNKLEDDNDIWAGVLAADGPVFCAGSDLTADGDSVTPRGGEYGIIRRARRKPLVAAVEAAALGGGLELVLACDVVVASTTASFGLPEVKRGLIPTCAGLFRGPRALPLNLVREMVLTGDSIDADRACTAGLVNVIAKVGTAREEAIALAGRICANAPLAVQASLAAINALEMDIDDRGWQVTGDARAAIYRSDDYREGVAAFFERRPPRWTGR
jgi:enoyl-CoA hydratase